MRSVPLSDVTQYQAIKLGGTAAGAAVGALRIPAELADSVTAAHLLRLLWAVEGRPRLRPLRQIVVMRLVG